MFVYECSTPYGIRGKSKASTKTLKPTALPSNFTSTCQKKQSYWPNHHKTQRFWQTSQPEIPTNHSFSPLSQNCKHQRAGKKSSNPCPLSISDFKSPGHPFTNSNACIIIKSENILVGLAKPPLDYRPESLARIGLAAEPAANHPLRSKSSPTPSATFPVLAETANNGK